MKQYPKYKDSGVEWLGEIPDSWKVKRIKYLVKRNKIAIKTGPFGSQLKSEDMSKEGVKVYNQRNVLDNDFTSGDNFISYDKYAALRDFEIFADDILITTRGTIGKCAIFPEKVEKGVLHPCLMRIQFDQEKVLNPYIKRYIQDSSLFTESVYYCSNATTIDVIYSDTLKQVQVPTPPIDEQNALLDYIDRKTRQIDTLIKKKQRMIELLKEERAAIINHVVTKGLNPKTKMKDSGIEWIGEVPVEWNIILIKRIVTEHKQGFYTNEGYVNVGTKLLRITDIDDFTSIDFSQCPHVEIIEKDKRNFSLEVGDFVFARSGTIGRFGIVRKKEDVVFASYLIRFRFDNTGNTDFLKYYFLSDYFSKSLLSDLHGGANQNIHAENIKYQYIVLPPSPEQRAIISYLDDKTAGIDSLVDKEQKSINLLTEYRTALISEVVTGKIDVRGET